MKKTSKPLEVVKYHECEVLEKYNHKYQNLDHEIAIQKLSDGFWYWVKYGDKRGNMADGIGYCPYCGAKVN